VLIYSTGYSRQQGPLMTSYPGNGNTSERGIVERLTGYFIGSVSSDFLFFTKGSFILNLK
jgi:hypothetical protein